MQPRCDNGAARTRTPLPPSIVAVSRRSTQRRPCARKEALKSSAALCYDGLPAFWTHRGRAHFRESCALFDRFFTLAFDQDIPCTPKQ